jgi:hypothetical protein
MIRAMRDGFRTIDGVGLASPIATVVTWVVGVACGAGVGTEVSPRSYDLTVPPEARATTQTARRMEIVERQLRSEVAVRGRPAGSQPGVPEIRTGRPRDLTQITRWIVERTRRMLEAGKKGEPPEPGRPARE